MTEILEESNYTILYRTRFRRRRNEKTDLPVYFCRITSGNVYASVLSVKSNLL